MTCVAHKCLCLSSIMFERRGWLKTGQITVTAADKDRYWGSKDQNISPSKDAEVSDL